MLVRKNLPHLSSSLCRRPAPRIRWPCCASSRFSSQSPFSRLSTALQLQKYSDEEIGAAFDRADANGNGLLEPSETETLADVDYDDIRSLVAADTEVASGIAREDFVKAVGSHAERLDYRIYPIAGSLVLTGFSIGIFGPATPLLIAQLGMTTAQTGVLTSCFGVAKLVGNIPFGVAADRYGRQPVIVFGCGCLSAGTLAVGAAASVSSYELVLLGRALNGLGVSALITGAFVAAADVSTPRNRARSMAPISMGFNFGNAFGPFAAGVLLSAVGLKYTFCGAGALLGLNTLSSLAIVRETKPAMIKSEQGFMQAYAAALQSWVPLLRSARLRQATLYQALFWGAFGGGFMTCLPVLLGSAKLGLSASALGMCYGGIAVTNVIAAQPLATLTDKLGKERAMLGGLGLLGTSLAMLPLCHDFPTLSLALGGWAISSTLLFPVPQAIAADHTSPEDRSNALAMVRTLGDVGLVAGGMMASLLGTTCSIETILMVVGGTCVCSSAGSVSRRLLQVSRT
mmetsp:Transcript_38295/g.110614  ORF Transcript_38295/g.110614 Transcript_38295/m.110614 type:complete len:514 (-) Transcript_38295:276-1817(-)